MTERSRKVDDDGTLFSCRGPCGCIKMSQKDSILDSDISLSESHVLHERDPRVHGLVAVLRQEAAQVGNDPGRDQHIPSQVVIPCVFLVGGVRREGKDGKVLINVLNI